MHRARILVVDDEANARSALRELLCDAGYDIALAASSSDGLALIDSFHPDVLLTDVVMPGMSGLELAKAAQARPSAPHVVFMSTYPPPRDLEAGWLSKPLDVDEMLVTLDRVARGV